MRIVPSSALGLLVALAAVASAEAKPGFGGNVCALLTAKQATSIHGVSSACKNAPALPAPGSTDHVGNWAGLSKKSPTLQITVSVYTDSGMLGLAQHNLKQGLVGSPKALKGVGDAAYQAKGADAVEIKTTVGSYIVAVVLTGFPTEKPPSSPALVQPVAKAVVSALSQP